MINEDMIINTEYKLIDSLKKMDEVKHKMLIICNKRKFVGIITIGDIQRAILAKCDLQDNVEKYIRSDIIYATQDDSIEDIINIMQKIRLECMPVIDDEGKLVDTIEWNDILGEKYTASKDNLHIPVVIMAGGKGTRLRPITNIIPKPLMPISDKTILENIMDCFVASGCNDFYITLNYKSEMIIDYFDNNSNEKYNIEYMVEDKPLGTAGALGFLKDKIKTTFFVSNCDILVDVNLGELVKYHKDNSNIITVVSSLKKYSIPYGTLETGENGILIDIKEKPDIMFQINTGLYLLEPEILDCIQENEMINLTDIIKTALNSGKKIGVFPVSEGAWNDMGNWNEYLKLVDNYINK